MSALLAFVVALLVSALVTAFAVPGLRWARVLDEPNARSSHTKVTPRGGGIGVVAGIACSCAVVGGVPGWPLWVGFGVLAVMGLADDMRKGGLPQSLRFVVQTGVAGLVVWQWGGVDRLPLPEPFGWEWGVLGIPLSVIWIVAVTNLYNFLDGIDGYAGTQGLVAGLGFGLVGGSVSGVVGLAVAGACAGFLVHNWHPARIFLGDVGSGALGFLFAALPFAHGADERAGMVLAAGLFLVFFLSDGAYTILRRAVKRERFWSAHRSHLYQRLTIAGLRHDEVTARVGVGMALVAGAVVLGWDWGALGLGVGGWAGMLVWTRWREG